MNRQYVVLFLAILMVLAAVLLPVWVQQAPAQSPAPNRPAAMPGQKAEDDLASALQGPSWIKLKGLTISNTHMGQMGGAALSNASAQDKLKPLMQTFLSTFRSNPEQASAILNQEFLVAGADLYRWNCRGCHGPDGKGFDPEINSVIGPVQGTSAALTRARMEARGIDADDEMVAQVSQLAEQSLRDRLQHGGTSMPSFAYLRPNEIEALLGYLEKLAAVPGSKRDGLLVSESPTRVGAHILRGTCHICHDGTGPGAGEAALMHGSIPSLASMPRDHSLSGLVHQIQYGSCSTMKLTGSDVMPAYAYLTEDEIAAVYFAAASMSSRQTAMQSSPPSSGISAYRK
jgi:mono/diheme cytochrome c family protein